MVQIEAIGLKRHITTGKYILYEYILLPVTILLIPVLQLDSKTFILNAFLDLGLLSNLVYFLKNI